MNERREQVRRRYAAAAAAVTDATGTTTQPASCCGPATGETPSTSVTEGPTAASVARPATTSATSTSCCAPVDVVEAGGGFGSALYGTDTDELPPAAVLASLGCGNPTAVAELHEGETVLDLGSGAGIDVLLSARRVGSTGRAYGLDMTDEMLELARANAAEAGADNVEFLRGYMEEIPLPDAHVDVVLSNCVINLSTDKPAVLQELARVTRPGGRLAISDVVAEDGLSSERRAERGSYVGCIAGALSFAEYRTGLEAAGFAEVSITPTHAVADGMHSAIVRAIRS